MAYVSDLDSYKPKTSNNSKIRCTIILTVIAIACLLKAVI